MRTYARRGSTSTDRETVVPTQTEMLGPRAVEILEEMLKIQRESQHEHRTRVGTMSEFRKLQPPTFFGTEGPLEAEAWLRKTDALLRAARIEEVQRVDIVYLQLEGDAHDWWDGVQTQYPRGATWEEFSERFLARYFPRAARREMEEAFTHLRQEGRTVGQYRAEFARLSRFAPDLVATDEKRRDRFIGGLSRSLRKDLVSLRGCSYDQIVEYALEYESLEEPEPVAPEIQRVVPKRPLEIVDRAVEPPEAKRFQQPLVYPIQQYQFPPAYPIQYYQLFPASLTQQYQPTQPRRHTGPCHFCGKTGHIRAECRAFLGQCLNCGSMDHQLRQCPGYRADHRAVIPRIEQPRPVGTRQRQRGIPLPPQQQQIVLRDHLS